MMQIARLQRRFPGRDDTSKTIIRPTICTWPCTLAEPQKVRRKYLHADGPRPQSNRASGSRQQSIWNHHGCSSVLKTHVAPCSAFCTPYNNHRPSMVDSLGQQKHSEPESPRITRKSTSMNASDAFARFFEKTRMS